LIVGFAAIAGLALWRTTWWIFNPLGGFGGHY
jgi:hypothetical protein